MLGFRLCRASSLLFPFFQDKTSMISRFRYFAYYVEPSAWKKPSSYHHAFLRPVGGLSSSSSSSTRRRRFWLSRSFDQDEILVGRSHFRQRNFDAKSFSSSSNQKNKNPDENDIQKTPSTRSTDDLSKEDGIRKVQSERKTTTSSWFRWSIISPKTRRRTGDLMIILGFGVSSLSSLYSNVHQFQQMQDFITAMRKFLQESQIDQEVLRHISPTLLNQLSILSRVQKKLLRDRDPRDFVALCHSLEEDQLISTFRDSLRYAKYAVAVYGDSAIEAARMVVQGEIDTRIFGDNLSLARVSEHIGIPPHDIAVLDIAYSGSTKHLRHFVALDRVNRKVVLALRGTFSLAEAFADAVAFSRPFCNGQAHSEMAIMAEKTWEVCSVAVLELLRKNDDYDFVITGHSLGAGTAALLNILCHMNDRQRVLGRKIQCFTFASPPVFEPLDAAPDAVAACTNYIHGLDPVPFLSVDSVRHTMASIAKMEDHLNKLSFTSRMRLYWGYAEPDQDLMNAMQRSRDRQLAPKRGAPVLYIPAAQNFWLERQTKQPGEISYNVKACDSRHLATFGIQMNANMVFDHFPQRYENALNLLCKNKKLE